LTPSIPSFLLIRDFNKAVTEKTGETTSPDRRPRFNGIHGRAQDAKDRDELCVPVTSP
jgi:hypothetical protein